LIVYVSVSLFYLFIFDILCNSFFSIYLFDLHEQQQGQVFPLWGTCQGFQLLCILAAQNESVDIRFAFDSEV
jgi:hypothetical protein